jgi:hypothetical protein
MLRFLLFGPVGLILCLVIGNLLDPVIKQIARDQR